MASSEPGVKTFEYDDVHYYTLTLTTDPGVEVDLFVRGRSQPLCRHSFSRWGYCGVWNPVKAAHKWAKEYFEERKSLWRDVQYLKKAEVPK